MTIRVATARRMLLNLSLLLFMACVPNCPGDPPTLSCDTVPTVIAPGTCRMVENPCWNHVWARRDSFRLCDQPSGIYVVAQTNPRARLLCASPDVGRLDDAPVPYAYRAGDEWGHGEFRVTISGPPLVVVASAAPTLIPPGGIAHLTAIPSGGTEPYRFSWTPTFGVSDPTIASPTASPLTHTFYTVVVTDAAGATATASVEVEVEVQAGLTACLTLTPLGAVSARADAGCSTGSIVEYRWWNNFSGDVNEPPDATTVDPVRTLLYEQPGTYTVRLQVVDASGATATVTETLTLP